MDTKLIKIVADSSADTLALEGVSFSFAPLKIVTDDKEYIDTTDLDVEKMVTELSIYNGKTSTACPSPNDWLDAFSDAPYVICVTITSNLSGSYNAACIAKQLYEEKHPTRKVFVLDTLSAGPELRLILEKLVEYIQTIESFNEICTAITNYLNHTGLIFMLESMKNLANNGRVSPIIARIAGFLGVRAVGKASTTGTLELLDKCKGKQKALTAILNNMKKEGMTGGKVRIGHCFNESTAIELGSMIAAEWPKCNIEMYTCRGLCSFYAEKGGMLIGFEKDL